MHGWILSYNRPTATTGYARNNNFAKYCTETTNIQPQRRKCAVSAGCSTSSALFKKKKSSGTL